MRWKTVEIITSVTRFIGVLFIFYITLCFGVLEKYNLRGIGTYDGYGLYWRCLVTCCLVFVLDFIAQIIKLALPVSRWPRLFQALLYLSSFVIVILISTNYPNLIYLCCSIACTLVAEALYILLYCYSGLVKKEDRRLEWYYQVASGFPETILTFQYNNNSLLLTSSSAKTSGRV